MADNLSQKTIKLDEIVERYLTKREGQFLEAGGYLRRGKPNSWPCVGTTITSWTVLAELSPSWETTHSVILQHVPEKAGPVERGYYVGELYSMDFEGVLPEFEAQVKKLKELNGR